MSDYRAKTSDSTKSDAKTILINQDDNQVPERLEANFQDPVESDNSQLKDPLESDNSQLKDPLDVTSNSTSTSISNSASNSNSTSNSTSTRTRTRTRTSNVQVRRMKLSETKPNGKTFQSSEKEPSFKVTLEPNIQTTIFNMMMEKCEYRSYGQYIKSDLLTKLRIKLNESEIEFSNLLKKRFTVGGSAWSPSYIRWMYRVTEIDMPEKIRILIETDETKQNSATKITPIETSVEIIEPPVELKVETVIVPNDVESRNGVPIVEASAVAVPESTSVQPEPTIESVAVPEPTVETVAESVAVPEPILPGTSEPCPKLPLTIEFDDQHLLFDIICNGNAVQLHKSRNYLDVPILKRFTELSKDEIKKGWLNSASGTKEYKFLANYFEGKSGKGWNPIFIKWFYKFTRFDMPSSITDILAKYPEEDVYIQEFIVKNEKKLANDLDFFKNEQCKIYDKKLAAIHSEWDNVLINRKKECNLLISTQKEKIITTMDTIKKCQKAGLNMCCIKRENWDPVVIPLLTKRNIQVVDSPLGKTDQDQESPFVILTGI